MRRYFTGLLLCLGLVLVALALPAHALPAPVHAAVTAAPHALPSATPAPVTAAMPSALQVLTSTAAAGGWVLMHWQGLGALISLLVAAYAAIRQRQWEALVALAGQITLNVATLSGFDNAKKRQEAEDRLYTMATPLMRELFSKEQFEHAVETGYQLITKPKLQATATGG